VLDIAIDENGTVFLTGRFDASQVDKAKEFLGKLNASIVADFSGLEYISSAGIGVILVTYKRLHDAGRTLRLVNMTERIKNVFQYAGLDKVFIIE
jgi:anti-anti-sigma factor